MRRGRKIEMDINELWSTLDAHTFQSVWPVPHRIEAWHGRDGQVHASLGARGGSPVSWYRAYAEEGTVKELAARIITDAQAALDAHAAAIAAGQYYVG